MCRSSWWFYGCRHASAAQRGPRHRRHPADHGRRPRLRERYVPVARLQTDRSRQRPGRVHPQLQLQPMHHSDLLGQRLQAHCRQLPRGYWRARRGRLRTRLYRWLHELGRPERRLLSRLGLEHVQLQHLSCADKRLRWHSHRLRRWFSEPPRCAGGGSVVCVVPGELSGALLRPHLHHPHGEQALQWCHRSSVHLEPRQARGGRRQLLRDRPPKPAQLRRADKRAVIPQRVKRLRSELVLPIDRNQHHRQGHGEWSDLALVSGVDGFAVRQGHKLSVCAQAQSVRLLHGHLGR